MMKHLKSFIKPNTKPTSKSVGKFLLNTSGHAGIMFGVMATMLVGGLATAIDLSDAFAARQRLQNTTDAIALLAAREGIEDQSELQAVAQAYFDQLYPNVDAERIEVLNISRNGDEVFVETRNNIDTNFAGFFGRDTLDVTVNSTTVFTQQSLDVALVLDVTGSMRGAKLAGLQNAATNLMDIFDDLDNDMLRVSIVPFAQYVNVGTNQNVQPWIDTNGVREATLCAGSRLAPLNTRVDVVGGAVPAIPGAGRGCPVAAIEPLTDDFRALKRKITSLRADGFTYAPAGLMWGWRTLDARAPFTEAASSSNGQKALVFMTDGANTRSADGEDHTGENRGNADGLTAELCEAIKDSDVTVYTIAYDVDDAGTRNLLQNCASNPTSFFNAEGVADLHAAFANISATLNSLRIAS